MEISRFIFVVQHKGRMSEFSENAPVVADVSALSYCHAKLHRYKKLVALHCWHK